MPHTTDPGPLTNISQGTAGGKDWGYGNALPFGFYEVGFFYPGHVCGMETKIRNEFSGDYNDYVGSQIDNYFDRRSIAGNIRLDLRQSYPRKSLRNCYKLAFLVEGSYTEEPHGQTVYLYCYDGEEVRNVTWRDITEWTGNDPASSPNVMYDCSYDFDSLGIFYGGIGIDDRGDLNTEVRLFYTYPVINQDSNVYCNTVPVFFRSEMSEDGTEIDNYLMSTEIDARLYGGHNKWGDYSYKGGDSGDEDDDGETPGNPITGIFEDLGFDLSDGMIRAVVLDDLNMRKLARNIALGKWAGNIGDAIISVKLFRLPGDPAVTTTEDIKVIDGHLSGEDVMGRFIANQFQQFNFGSFKITEKFGSFLDYNNTTLSLYLPYCGLQNLDTKPIINSLCTLSCGIDYVSGNVIWYLEVTRDGVDQVLYSWNGTCSMDMPITAQDYALKLSQALSGFMSLTSSISLPSVASKQVPRLIAAEGGGFKSSGVVDVVKQYNKTEVSGGGMVSAVDSLLESTQPNYIQVGNVSSNNGWTGIQYPFIFIGRSKVPYPLNYKQTVGIPSMKKARLGDLHGFTQVQSIHMDGVQGTKEELENIERILKEGVIL